MSEGHYLPRTFTCLCGHSHALVDDNDVWTDKDGRIIGRTACLLAAGRITQEQADAS
jgi:hypothetical protein